MLRALECLISLDNKAKLQRNSVGVQHQGAKKPDARNNAEAKQNRKVLQAKANSSRLNLRENNMGFYLTARGNTQWATLKSK